MGRVYTSVGGYVFVGAVESESAYGSGLVVSIDYTGFGIRTEFWPTPVARHILNMLKEWDKHKDEPQVHKRGVQEGLPDNS